MIAERELTLPLEGNELGATLGLPERARGLIIFAHGSGSSRYSRRNRIVAQSLGERGFATLLLDLLTDSEEEIDRETAALRFDIALLARRVDLATSWWRKNGDQPVLPIGYFGASTGAGAALLAASQRDDVAAIVSRGGRPDLAGPALTRVRAATLFIVGERDTVVIDLNRQAAAQIRAHHEMAIVRNAGHLFEEPGALEQVARLAGDWFARYVVAT
jgi:putative phosphoribosyl transferase